ncbi:MAG: SH3 domain-containing protein [Desulfobaccales bacterium]
MKTAAVQRLRWTRLVGFCLALWLAGCAPKIYETPYIPPPLPSKPTAPPAVSREVFYVAVNRLNLRGCAGMDCPKISVLEQNEVVEKLGEMDDWYEVMVKRDGRRGWVTGRYLSPEPVPATPEAPPPPAVAPAPPTEPYPAPPPAVEKPAPPPPAKPPVVEKPKPAKPGEAPPPPKKKPEEAKPAKPGEPAAKPAPKPAPAPEKPAPPKEKPAPPAEKPAPPPAEPEQPKKIRIM